MSKKAVAKGPDDSPKITQKDIDRATFRIGLEPAPKKHGGEEIPAKEVKCEPNFDDWL